MWKFLLEDFNRTETDLQPDLQLDSNAEERSQVFFYCRDDLLSGSYQRRCKPIDESFVVREEKGVVEISDNEKEQAVNTNRFTEVRYRVSLEVRDFLCKEKED